MWGSETLVGWSWLGARVESLVCKQAEQCAIAKPEIQLCRKRAPPTPPPPNLHSHLLPYPFIHHPIHHRPYSTAWPPLLDSATLSNRPDGLNEIHPTVHSRLHHSQPLLSCFSNATLFQHSFAKVAQQNQPNTMSLWAWQCTNHYKPKKKKLNASKDGLLWSCGVVSKIFTVSHFQALNKAAGEKPNLESVLYFVLRQASKHILCWVRDRVIWSDQCELITEGTNWTKLICKQNGNNFLNTF